MTPEQSIECAELITSVYPNTAGKTAVVNAYARQLAPYPYRFVGEVLTAMPARHEGDFCPSIHEIFDAMATRYQALVTDAVRQEAARVYPLRYNAGDTEHEQHFIVHAVTKCLAGVGAHVCMRALLGGTRPVEYVDRNKPSALGPRDGGPIDPPHWANRDRPRIEKRK